MENLPPPVLYDEQTIQQFERDSRHGEEVEGHDDFAVVLKKGKPCLCRGHHDGAHVGDSAKCFSPRPRTQAFCSSPCIFGAPQPGFSCANRRINTRSSLVIFGRPGRWRDRHRQYQRKLARCQATTVSGLTMSSTFFQPEKNLRSPIQNNRSNKFKGGFGRFRLRITSCCLSARTSSAVAARDRKRTRIAATTANR